jgi:tight adherence protein B
MRPSLSATFAALAVIALVGAIRRVTRTTVGSIRGIERWTIGRDLARSLGRAGLRIGPDAFVAGVLAAAGCAAGTTWAVLHSLAGALIVVAGVIASAVSLVRSADQRYTRRLAGQMPQVAQHLSGAIGAGLSLRQAVERACVDVAEPAATELGWLAGQLRLGARIDDAFDRFAERVPETGLRMMVTAIAIQRTVGGNLAGALATLAKHLEERDRLAREVRSATAQARMSAWLVAGLPAVGGLAVELAEPGTLERTLGRGPGRVLLVGAVVLEALGVFVVRRLVESVTAEGRCLDR